MTLLALNLTPSVVTAVVTAFRDAFPNLALLVVVSKVTTATPFVAHPFELDSKLGFEIIFLFVLVSTFSTATPAAFCTWKAFGEELVLATVKVALGDVVPIPTFPPTIPILPLLKKRLDPLWKLRVSTPFSCTDKIF
jgi:hypothetical protein